MACLSSKGSLEVQWPPLGLGEHLKRQKIPPAGSPLTGGRHERRILGRAQDEGVGDPYKLRRKLPEPTRCPACGAVYHEGRWQWMDRLPANAHEELCQACHRINDEYPAGIVTLKGPVHLGTKVPFAITCIKKRQRVGSATFYQRTTLTIAASGASPLAIVFPSDTLNGYELASQASLAVSQAASDVNVAQAATAAEKQIADQLQNRLNGVTVSVYARDLEAHNCFGTGSQWGNGFDREVSNTCGSRPSAKAVDNLHPGGTCGQAAVAFACANIP